MKLKNNNAVHFISINLLEDNKNQSFQTCIQEQKAQVKGSFL